MSMIEVSVESGVATLVLANPGRKNAINPALMRELEVVLEALRRDESVKALVLTGAGDDFSAGGDISSSPGGTDAVTIRARLLDYHRVLKTLVDFDRPVIAVVDGVAYGAGFGLALLADFVVASDRARFCFAFSRIGLVPDFGVAYTLPRMIGIQRARALIYSARQISASEALALGIVLEVHPPATLASRARELALATASLSPEGFALTKRLLAQTWELDFASLLDAEANAQALATTSPYVADAVGRFMRKEAPVFQWPE
ncbi:enoyl-CoA hydratase/isomerase family protein [Paraburkholderia domus]|uniref:enoyl-CoA hydratase/isomerase family protein n=1 Tax=Paraburkholderia domus TaxID=2793075 RepID=UPI001B2A7355|nr:enoyl-CoA hydratase/isomerase family protein [Paraburkholderia domus]CAE6821488.1 Short-chain-enoyl-CoA hydratase [Paraburkholderia domus]